MSFSIKADLGFVKKEIGRRISYEKNKKNRVQIFEKEIGNLP